MPARPNPERRDWLEALYAGDANLDESRPFERDGTWYLHVAVIRDVEECSDVSGEERTPVGVDIGEASLVTVCHRDDRGCPTAPELWADEGKTVPRLRETYFTAKRRLQQRGSERITESFGDDPWNQIDDAFHRVAREVVEYAESVENPVLVLEDLTHIRESMDDGECMNRRFHGWGFARLRAQIRYTAVEKGIPVETVSPRNTSKDYEFGGRPEAKRLREAGLGERALMRFRPDAEVRFTAGEGAEWRSPSAGTPTALR